jgi:hypothetical protein
MNTNAVTKQSRWGLRWRYGHNQIRGHKIIPIKFLYLHAPSLTLWFTLPCLNGSMPLHSFVTPIKEMESVSALSTGLSPLGGRSGTMLHDESCE